MSSTLRDPDSLIRVHSAGRCEHHDLRVGVGEEGREACEPVDAGALLCSLQSTRIRVAHGHQFQRVGVVLNRLEMLFGDAAAADDRQADFFVHRVQARADSG